MHYTNYPLHLYNLLTLCDKDLISHNFRNMDKIGFPYNYISRGERIAEFIIDNNELPEYFMHDNNKYNINEWLFNHNTTGLVVLKIDNITQARLLYENYYLGNNKNSKAISWSVGKSIMGALVGLAVQDGYIESINDKVSDYVDSLGDSPWNNITIKNVLQMSSGIQFDENYFDLFSDINIMMAHLVLGYDLEYYASNLGKNKEQGISLDYISINTQVLGMIVKHAINKQSNGSKSLTTYLHEKLWKRVGFECDLFWLLDNNQSKMELAFGTMNTCTRDYARFGWLYLNKGKAPLDGEQLINEQWVIDSITPDSSYLMPNKNNLGYGYQWWIPSCENDNVQQCDDYLAIGVYNQFIYVSPKNNIVIAKNSAYADYENNCDISEIESISFFREITKKFSKC